MFYRFLTLFVISSLFSLQAGPLKDQITERKNKSKGKAPTPAKMIMKKGIDSLKASGILERVLKKGRKMPSVSFLDESGKQVSLATLYERKPVVLTFYRGGWCPYCMLELKEYQRMLGDFEKAGAMIVAIAPDTYKEINKTKRKHKLSFTFFSDKNNGVAKRMGLAFKLDDGTLGVYKKFGINLEASQNNKNNELPMPGTYVVNRAGKIVFAFVDPDYTKRAEPSDVLKVLQSLR